jgi:hypothetical protein
MAFPYFFFSAFSTFTATASVYVITRRSPTLTLPSYCIVRSGSGESRSKCPWTFHGTLSCGQYTRNPAGGNPEFRALGVKIRGNMPPFRPDVLPKFPAI